MSLPPPRNLSLDVFRGLTLALMIVVNTPGSWDAIYAPLAHAQWHGYTPTDLVFPSFLFIVGAALQASAHKFEGMGEAAFLRTVFKRAALIFLCGFLLYWFPFFDADFKLMPVGGTRIMGVLQRIGLCYLCAALIVRHGGVRAAWAASVMLLLSYWWLLWRFGDYTLEGNAARRLDLFLLGPAHLYQGEGIAFDPEGILSTLPAIVNVLAGYLAMVWRQRPNGLARIAIAGADCLVLAILWHLALPINKKLWTSSYVSLTVGVDLLVLAALAWMVDVRGVRRGLGFFLPFGRNPLFIYLLSEVAAIVLYRVPAGGVSLYHWLYQHLFRVWAEPKPASLMFALAFMLACWLVAYGLDRRRIYIKL